MLEYRPVDASLRALAEPTRRAIVERLSAGPASVSELARPLQISLAAVVQHIQLLEETGLVASEKVGRTRTCRLRPEGLDALADWVAERRRIIERRYDRLAALLDEDQSDRPEKKT